ncbi:MAG: ammonium transporter [bacterium]
MKEAKRILLPLSFFLMLPASALAQEEAPVLDKGDTAWMIVATALVMFMTPVGLALFYGGMSRSKNVLNTFGLSFVSYAIGSIFWMLWGYTLSFGPDVSGFIGGLSSLFLNGIGPADLRGTIPAYLFVLFQMTFAAITVALISGSIVERMKFSSWVVFSLLWLTFVYAPVCHWVWGGGWLGTLGALDFAGGTVVHINAGVSGLVLALMLGKRRGYRKEIMLPSSIMLTAAGAAMLLFGWFGFNAGSQLASDGLAASAFLVTNTAACVAALTWMGMEWFVSKKPTLLGLASGLVAGLVGITPAAGFVDLAGSLIIGIGAGLIGYAGVALLKPRLGYDDSLDAFGVHGLCGTWGALATGLLANPAVNELGKGLFYGNPRQLLVQIVSIAVTAVYAGLATFVLASITKAITGGLRVSDEDEMAGLDESIHGERAFAIQ